MKRRILLLLLLSALPASALLMTMLSAVPAHARQPRRGKQQRPNIVFIISDDHRWDALGAAGNPKIKTPVLDRLAREGVYFRQATIHVSQCAPSRATLLTGLSPHQSGYYANNFLRPDMQWADRFAVPTLPGLLREAGYQTVLAGKWHLVTDPWLTGFSDVRTWLPEGASSYVDSRLARGNSRRKETRKGFTNGIFADDAVEFLSSAAAKEKPFLLWLASTIPHAPFQPNPSHIEHLYEGEATADLHPPGFPPDTPVKLALEGLEAGTESSLVKYYESVSYLDELVGRVLLTLERQGLADNTIVVFLGDNGLMAGSRGVRGKVVPWEESVRVPFIIRAPPQFAALRGPSDVPASSLDIPATLLALAGVARPKEWGGRDLRPVLAGGRRHGIDHAVSVWADTESQFRHYTHRLIRTPRHKLVRWDKADKPDELYDLITDPHETKNIIDRPAMRAVRDGLLGRLNAWMARTNDPARFWPRKNGKTRDRAAAEARDEAGLRAGLDDKTPAKVDPRVFDAYVGRYEFVTRATVSISKEGDRLMLQGVAGGKSELIPKSEAEFLHGRQPMRFTFVKDAKGRVTHMVRRNSLSDDVRTFDMKARKIE